MFITNTVDRNIADLRPLEINSKSDQKWKEQELTVAMMQYLASSGPWPDW